MRAPVTFSIFFHSSGPGSFGKSIRKLRKTSREISRETDP